MIPIRRPFAVTMLDKAKFCNIARGHVMTSNVMIPRPEWCMFINRNELVCAIRHRHPRAQVDAPRFSNFMKPAANPGDVGRELGRCSQTLAEHEARRVPPERLAQAVSEYVEWWTFAFWVRFATDIEGRVSEKMQTRLDQRCPGFLQYAMDYNEQHPEEREFLWLRLIEWIDSEVFRLAVEEGWSHALGYYAARDPGLDRVRKYWAACEDSRGINPPPVTPSYEEWCGMIGAQEPSRADTNA
jgi:hypothetical protein